MFVLIKPLAVSGLQPCRDIQMNAKMSFYGFFAKEFFQASIRLKVLDRSTGQSLSCGSLNLEFGTTACLTKTSCIFACNILQVLDHGVSNSSTVARAVNAMSSDVWSSSLQLLIRVWKTNLSLMNKAVAFFVKLSGGTTTPDPGRAQRVLVRPQGAPAQDGCSSRALGRVVL